MLLNPVGKGAKGGIFPWVQNAPGTYAEVAKLSEYNFLGADGDKFIGWGFMPNSVKALYTNGKGRGPMLASRPGKGEGVSAAKAAKKSKK